MRRVQKKQVEECLTLLALAHQEIREGIKKNKATIVQELLIQCQEGVRNLGMVLVAMEGEIASIMTILEQYEELTYQIYQELLSKFKGKAENVYERLQTLLFRMEHQIKGESKERVEVVFLPYKASMWDSLESVWKVADEDPNCTAFVIPIPYYDKGPDGKFKEFHYEGDQYPEYVPIVDYRTYDFSKRKPDMIFIHNPYDECNYVTSVHPFFYSKNLKEFTDKLVYIPYFVLGEIDPNNSQALEGMAHFCTLPAVIHADKVIVQSEQMRQAYIHIMTEFVEGSSRKYWEEKILGLGSPKFDKVQNTKREELAIPKDWKKILEKPDGSRKKVILYNNSVSALLQYDRKMIEKMKEVFRVFYENREEVALLWRPHPLIKATIESMRPHLWKEYEKMTEEYKKAGWGIYDDTAELERAIEVSDAYYGDRSSLIQLCQKRLNFFMIQNCEFYQYKENKRDVINYIDLEVDRTENTILCLSVYENSASVVCTIDENTLEIREFFEYPVADNKFLVGPFSYAVKQIDKLIYFVPHMWVNGNHILIYNKEKKETRKLGIKVQAYLLDDSANNVIKKYWNNQFFYSDSPKFQGIYQWRQSLFFVPNAYPAIVQYDINKNNFLYYEDFIEEIISLSKQYGERKRYAFESSVKVESKIFLTCRYADLLVEFDMKICKSRVILLSNRSFGNSQIQFDGTNLWIFALNRSEITRWNLNTGEVVVFNNYAKEIVFNFQWHRVLFFHNNLFAFVIGEKREILKIDVVTGYVTIVKEFRKYISKNDEIDSFASSKEAIYIVTRKGKILSFSKELELYYQKDFKLSDSQYDLLYNQYFNMFHSEDGIFENISYQLSDFINLVKRNLEREKSMVDEIVGENIYMECRTSII